MAPVVYLHIGGPKTGTSFLQDLLWNNREALAREGVTLPGTRRGQFQATVDLRELSLEGRSPDVAGAWSRLADDILASAGTVVVSHDLFSGASEEQARRAVESLRSAEVHVVYTARDLARQVPSQWQQHVKARMCAPMGEFVDHVVAHGPLAEWFWHAQDPAKVLRRWGATLPPERVHLVTVPPQGADLDLLWHRFASLIGVHPGGYDTTAARTNPSLGAVEVELLRRVNVALGDRLPLPGPHSRFVKEELAHGVLAKRGDKVPFGMRSQHQVWLAEESERIVDELSKLDCHVVGDLDELLPTGGESPGHPDDVGDAALLDAGVNAIAGLLERLRDQATRAPAAERRAREKHAQAGELRQRLTNTKRDMTAVRKERARKEEIAAALEAELEARRRRPVKQALIDLSEKHGLLMVARRRYWRAVNAIRTWR